MAVSPARFRPFPNLIPLVQTILQEPLKFDETLPDFAPASLPVLDQLARGTQLADAGVFAARTNGEYVSACQANACFLPKYTGKVLRVRHIVFSPLYEFDGTLSMEDYGRALVNVFVGVIRLSNGEMKAEHIKFHLRSPAERRFGDLFTRSLEGHGAFEDVSMSGSWIYLSKSQNG